jgi:hypothetical protein
VQDAVAGTVPEVASNDSSRFLIVAGANVNGIRRVGRFDLAIQGLDQTTQVAFALVYLPEGMTPDVNVNFSAEDAATSLYSPEQHVILSGVVSGFNVSRYFSYQTRSLASQDSIFLVLRTPIQAGTPGVTFRCSFIVAFG